MSAVSALFALAGILFLPGPDPPTPNETAADVLTLRDGRTVPGVLIEPWNPGSVGLYVRRSWARDHLPEWAERWEAAEGPSVRRASAQRRDRLEAWRRERGAYPLAKDDRITPWIDHELARLRDGDLTRSPVLIARFSRNDVRTVTRAPRGLSRLLRLGWLAGFPNPETMRADDLKNALDGRRLDADSKTPVSIDALLPPKSEADSAWLTRRAATEVSFDAGLRFIRHQGLVLPETEGAPQLNTETISAGLSALKNLLGDEPVDPLPARLREVEGRGRVGAMVTSLDVAPDMSSVTVEIALWVRHGRDRWSIAGSRKAQVRPDDLGPDAGKDLADDPQVAAAFRVVEALGFGQAAREVKQRSLTIGAATRKALGQARTAANEDLGRLALPVLEPDRDPKPRPGGP